VPGSLLTAALRLVHDGLMTLPQAVATVTVNPARAVGMADRGALTEGLRADLVQVRLVDVADGNQHAVVRAVWREGQRVL
jgi:alpha-D-ribose 1-methylphosphonate 5-triphosphate diphosphatase